MSLFYGILNADHVDVTLSKAILETHQSVMTLKPLTEGTTDELATGLWMAVVP